MIDPDRPDYTNTPAASERPRFGYHPAGGAAPCLSIVTPFFNTGREFHETAASVLRQSLQQWEWIIVNDGSTDPSSLGVLEGYRAVDARVRVIDHAANRGPGAARNTGYAHATAPLVLQLDSDNLLEPTAAEKWCWYMETHPAAAFVKGYTVGFGEQEYLWNRGFHDGALFLRENLVDATAVVRRSTHAAAGGYDEDIRGGLEDWNFWLRCASLGQWGGTVPEYLDWFRRRAAHSDRWPDWDRGSRERRFRARLRDQFPTLWSGRFPDLRADGGTTGGALAQSWPFENVLEKTSRRILLVTPWLSLGGSDKFNLDLIDQLRGRGWEVSVATTLAGDDRWLPAFAARTPDVFVLNHFLPLRDYPRFLAYLIHSRQVDAVVVTHSELGYRLLPYLRAQCPGVPFLDYVHVVEPVWLEGGYPRLSVEYQEQVDLTVASSDHVRRWMIDQGADPSRIEVCYTGVDTARYSPAPGVRRAVRRELKVPDDAPVILFAGRLCAQKQPLVLAAALGDALARVPDAVAWIAGDGPQAHDVRRAVRRHRLGQRVRLLGPVPPEEVRRLMQAADIAFLPSAWEGIALVAYEAMATGLALVTADAGGQRELVVEGTGVLMPAGQPTGEAAKYADALVALATDRASRSRIGDAARSRVEALFRIDAMGQRMVDLINRASVLAETQPRLQLPPGLALGSAATAVELARLADLSERLWRERTGRTAGQRTYLLLNRWLSPAYQWGVMHGVPGVRTVGDAVRRMLLRAG